MRNIPIRTSSVESVTFINSKLLRPPDCQFSFFRNNNENLIMLLYLMSQPAKSCLPTQVFRQQPEQLSEGVYIPTIARATFRRCDSQCTFRLAIARAILMGIIGRRLYKGQCRSDSRLVRFQLEELPLYQLYVISVTIYSKIFICCCCC